MSHFEHRFIGDHDYFVTPLRKSTYHHFASRQPLFDPQTSDLRLCSLSILHEGRPAPPVHGDVSSGEYFRSELGTEVPLSRPGWIANGPSFSQPFFQPYEGQEAQHLETPLFVSSFNQGDRSSDCLLGNGTFTYANPVLRPPLAGTDSPADSPTATEPEERHSRSRDAYSGFINDSFPLSTPSHFGMRRALATVMTAPWKLQNVFEPRHSTLLLSFLEHREDSKRWFCCFYVKGVRCACNFSKKDQAKNHIRFHIEHLPFCCRNSRGICPKDGLACFRRFCSAEALQKHRGPQKNCTNCGKLMLKSNLRRHSASACRNRRHAD